MKSKLLHIYQSAEEAYNKQAVVRHHSNGAIEFIRKYSHPSLDTPTYAVMCYGRNREKVNYKGTLTEAGVFFFQIDTSETYTKRNFANLSLDRIKNILYP